MAYTSNVPQGNQQIATTQPLIQANFSFLSTGIGVEHNFNATGSGSDMYHLQASMPNKALSPSLPAGTNGQYFVSSGLSYFWDGTTNWRLNPYQDVLTGTYTPTSSTSFNTVIAVPANTVGHIIFYNGPNAVQTGAYTSTGTRAFGYSNRMKLNGSSDDYPIELNNTSSTLNLQGRAFSNSWINIAYSYKIFYRPA